jgi:hypothetical protein
VSTPHGYTRAEVVGFICAPLAVMASHADPVGLGVALVVAFPVVMIWREFQGARAKRRR